MNAFKNFVLLKLLKLSRTSLKNLRNMTLCTKLSLKNHLIEIFHQNQLMVKANLVPNQKIVTLNHSYPPSLEIVATVKNLIVHPNHSLLEKQKASILASKAGEKFDRQFRLIE